MKSLFDRYINPPASRRKDTRIPWVTAHIALWASAILLYGLGDFLTTAAVLAAGGRELNPVLAAVSLTFGSRLWGPAIIKVATLGSLAAIYLYGCLRHRWAIPALLTLVGLGLVLNNLIAGASL